MSNISKFIRILAMVKEQLDQFAKENLSQSHFASFSAAVDPRDYGNESRVECYIDVELLSGISLAWWLEFREIDGSWLIETSVLHTTPDGQDEIRELPDRFAATVEELAFEVQGAANMLLNSISIAEVMNL